MNQDTIWVVINTEDTQGQANTQNVLVCAEVCSARIKHEADMMYATLCEQAHQLHNGDRIVMHQDGSRTLGGQFLVAAGHVNERARLPTLDDIKRYPNLWEVTKCWYKYWPRTIEQLNGEQIIHYQLNEVNSPADSPHSIRPRPGGTRHVQEES
ncbi:hypothetical protein ACFLTP_06780 [Chloroflexota bacterium]